MEADNGTIEVAADPDRFAPIGNAGLPLIDLGGEVDFEKLASFKLDLILTNVPATDFE